MRFLRCFAASALFVVPAFAQAPGWSRGQQTLKITYEQCVQRATKALEAQGYRIDYAAGAFAVGLRDVHTAVITCTPVADGTQVVNVFVASNGEGGGVERQQLQAQMERATPARTGGGAQGGTPQQGRILTVRMNGLRAIVDWANAPTTSGAWVSIVPAGTGDGAHVGNWVYTESKPSGRYEKGPLAPGAWEARFYGDGGYSALVDRVKFTVSGDSPAAASKMLAVRLDGRVAVVTWSGAPTTEGAWVSVVPFGSADGTHIGMWTYTNQTASGTYQTGALAAGEWEARFYGDGGYGTLLERVRFRVN